MTVMDLADDMKTAFADIICTDPEWVRSEFEELVAEEMPGVMTDTMPVAREAGNPFFVLTLHATGTHGALRKRLKKVRSPPLGAGRVRP